MPLSENQVLVIACYENWEFQGQQFLVEYDASLQQEQTDQNPAHPDTVNVVAWWPDSADVGDLTAPFDIQGAVLTVLKPQLTKTVSFYYKMSGYSDTTIQSWTAMVGKVNNATWDGGSKDTWLCTNVKSNLVGNSLQVKVSCQFLYKPETWLQWASFRAGNGLWPSNSHKNPADPTQLGPGATGSNGWYGFLPYLEGDFTIFPFG